MTHPTDPAAAMREAAAKVAEGLAGENSYKASVCDEIVAAIRAIPLPAAPPDPRRSVEEIRAEIARLQTELVDAVIFHHPV